MLKRLYSITGILTINGLGFIILVFWQLLELMIEGKIQESRVDSIIAVILVFSLYGNYDSYMTNKEKKNGKEIE